MATVRTAHSIVENQITDETPKEVWQVIEAMMRQGLSRHEVIHRVVSVLSEEMYHILCHILRDDRPFDERGYIRKLRRLVR